MTRNGDRFEAAYNKIDQLLRKKLSVSKAESFASVVLMAAKVDPVVRAVKDDLLEYSELRNAIVHDRGRSGYVIADPRDDVVTHIEAICANISAPRTLRTIPCAIPIRIFAVHTPLPEVLTYLKKNDFSQVITVRDNRHGILSAEGCAHWLEAKAQDDLIQLSETTLGDVLRFEPSDTCKFLKAGDTVEYAREVFARDAAKRIFSALVTEHGKQSEKPINIITPWDVVSGALRGSRD